MATWFPVITKEVADAIDAWEHFPLFQDMTWSTRTRRAMKALERYGLNLYAGDLNFADICQFSEKDLLGIPGFGRKGLEELRAKMSEFGWKLADQSHSPKELNSRFRRAGAPMWWDWHGSIRRHLASEAHKERCKKWDEQRAWQATQPTFSIPTDPEARDKWLRTGEGLIEGPPAGKT